MSYIGSQPADSYLALSKQDFTTSETTTYTLSNSVTSASDIALFINFVRQEPTTAYSASGTTLTLTEATSASDDMYCVYLGRTVGTINPPNGSVGTAQIADLAVTSGKMFSGFANGITMADQWRLTANLTANALPITSNLERVDEPAFGGIGTGMTESSGVFSFPQTGIYLVKFTAYGNAVLNDNLDITIEVTTDNSTYNDFTVTGESGDAGTGACTLTAEAMIDVTDTSNVKVRFEAGSIGSGSSILGNTDVNYTYMTFIRLGDT